MDDEYTLDDVREDLEALAALGLIEVKGIREDGEWLWGVTAKATTYTEDEIEEMIRKSI